MSSFVDACIRGDVEAIDEMYPLTEEKDQYNRTPTAINSFSLFKGLIGAIESRKHQVVEALEKRGIEIPGVMIPPTFTCAAMSEEETDDMYHQYRQDWSKMVDVDPVTFASFYDSVIEYYDIGSHEVFSFRDKNGNAFLIAVILQNNNEILQSLLNSGFDCDRSDLGLYFKTACEEENIDIITTLVNYMTISDLLYIFKTYGKCHDGFKELAYEKFASLLSEDTPFWKKFDMNSEDTFFLYKLIGRNMLGTLDSNRENIFHHLARVGDMETFQNIISKYGIDYIDIPNLKGNTPMMLAIINGHYDLVSLIISVSKGKLQKTNKVTGKSARDLQYLIKNGQTRLRMEAAIRKW